MFTGGGACSGEEEQVVAAAAVVVVVLVLLLKFKAVVDCHGPSAFVVCVSPSRKRF